MSDVNGKELRIGNIALTEEGYVKLIGVHVKDGLDSEPYPNIHEPRRSNVPVGPVPLSDEWLQKMNFKEGVLPIGMGTIHGYLSSANGGTQVAYRDQAGNTLSRYFEYVHQVQNFYLDLTGKELEIK